MSTEKNIAAGVIPIIYGMESLKNSRLRGFRQTGRECFLC
jgi:hypothetical protein